MIDDMPTQRVLIVDDQSSLLTLLEVLLRDALPAAEVVTANSASRALAVLHDQPCDLVVSDVNMPRHDGLFLLNEVKRQWPTVQVILMSGMPLPEQAPAAGADGFLLKPFDVQEFQKTVRAVLSEEPQFIGLAVDIQA